ncbi:hypothetical protein DTO013E5_5258 [Penicillium roqueforti]|uniref:uncharacterized protein n=1 Tax=Penicillium roqueforti TaxID=5082 RepID=UPI001909CFFA|nr:uncharacterized protein LCP9604111_5493 [Penicillium roqueforti]KAF9248238.1 hypothetical protein LCP9604111_5493 [Penicillium roqueforti]KAI1836095.1 hypothetical protein CBS147337_3244 [Penicillium roqueforti]KAI2676945.1 hypothetical protein LCP963914a_8240 [Penicillium roqueforti]KAI2683118.1 hypothetical protein CBS147355_2258 [Penicillium roqueforti]KAI2701686.1 hypothetical protein CBS147372_4739 [Penicillium roqueforti]
MGSNDNLQSQAIGLIFAFPCFASAAVALRLYSRTLTKSFAAVIIYTYIGYNVWDIPNDYPAILGSKYTYATELLYNPILALVKTSILLFLLRLTGQKHSVRLAIWGLLIFNGIAAITTFFITVLHCIPVAANWDAASYPNAKCLDFANFVTGTGSVSILTDILALILPTWIVYRLQMQRRQKLMLIGILSLGLLTVAAGIIRLILLDHFDRHMPENYTHSVLFCVSTIEVGLSFIAACAPSFKPLVTRLVPKLFGSSRTGRYNSSSNRLGYNLEDTSNFTRRTHDQTVIVEAGDGEIGHSHTKLKADNAITMTTEMEVTWGRSNCEEQDTSSTESLVYGKGSSRRSK